MRSHVISRLAYKNILLGRISSRSYSQPVRNPSGRTPQQEKAEFFDEPIDPRPPWFYTTSTLLRAVLIPSGLIYGIFFHDFGQDEHVFMPPRRWLQRQKDAFFTLSPEERRMVQMDREEASRSPLGEEGKEEVLSVE